MGKQSLAQSLSTLQAGEDESDGTEHEPCSCAASDTHHLFAVDGEIVAQHTEAEAEEHHIHSQQPASGEEETV